MVRLNEIRTNEVAIAPPQAEDAALVFIGRISTPWTSRLETPRQGRPDGPVCTIEIFELAVTHGPEKQDQTCTA